MFPPYLLSIVDVADDADDSATADAAVGVSDVTGVSAADDVAAGVADDAGDVVGVTDSFKSANCNSTCALNSA